MRGTQRFGRVLMALLAAGALGRVARADDAPKTIEQRVEDIEKKIDQSNPAATLGVTIHGLAAVDYLYDINRPEHGAAPALRSFEDKSNSFILNLGNLHFERASKDGVGFVSDVDFGETANVVNNTTFFGRTNGTDPVTGDSLPQTGNGTDFFDVRQFYLTYTIPVGSGIKIQAGRFVTLHGAEVIKSYNNLNYNITNSILFGFAIPFTHTGLMGTYALTDTLSLSAGVVNGWDTVADNNDGKSVHGMLTWAPDPMVSIAMSGTYGPEQFTHSVTDNLGNTLVVHAGRSKRLMLTPLITIKPIDPLQIIIDYNYGNESDVEPRDGLLRTAEWQGVAGYIIYAFTDSLSGTLRGEVFDDGGGTRVTSPVSYLGHSATYWEFTPTISYKLIDGLFWRNEYRHDEGSRKVFPSHSGNGFAHGQDTLATELVYSF